MTWITSWKVLLAPAIIIGSHLPLSAQDDLFAETQPVVLDPQDSSVEEVGGLIYRGGLELAPSEKNIGGISGLEWHEDRLYAVSDDGHWLILEPDEINGRLIDLLSVTRGDLVDDRGSRLRRDDDIDAEAIAFSPSSGEWTVAFERRHRFWRYSSLGERGTGSPATILEEPILRSPAPTAPDEGYETLAFAGDGMLGCLQSYKPGEDNCFVRFGERDESFALSPPSPLLEDGGVPTDAACLIDGTCFVLFRSKSEADGNRAAIVQIDVGTGESGTLGILEAPLNVDQFEGLAVREQFGKTYLYIASDNNFSDDQRTLLMKFEVKVDEPLIAATPEPEVDYETQDVMLVTDKGEITIRLEIERAPITTANFLRYIDEDRFDGTVFYRAMKLDREPMPNGLIQGGTQFDPKRILPPIPHETTTQTGLSHTNGAISMAMLEPGSATGDFSIMLADQIGLDAQPDSEDPIWKHGYAVFGYVIAGMDVVSAIHAGEADPNKGEGQLRGQILADPVTIVDARRIEVEAPLPQ